MQMEEQEAAAQTAAAQRSRRVMMSSLQVSLKKNFLLKQEGVTSVCESSKKYTAAVTDEVILFIRIQTQSVFVNYHQGPVIVPLIIAGDNK